MSLRLVIEHSTHPQRVREMRHPGGELSIGRGPECSWQLDDPDMYVSRKHCVISGGPADPGGAAAGTERWFVTDASRGGLFVDGGDQPLGPGTTAPLEHGMRLRLGDVVIRVEIETAGAAPQRAAPTPVQTALDGDDFFSRPVAAQVAVRRPEGLPDPFETGQPRFAGAAATSGRPTPPPLFDDPFTLDPVATPRPTPAAEATLRPAPLFADPFAPAPASAAPPPAGPVNPRSDNGPPAPAKASAVATAPGPAPLAPTDSAGFSFDSFFGDAPAAASPAPAAVPTADDGWGLPPLVAAAPASVPAEPGPAEPSPVATDAPDDWGLPASLAATAAAQPAPTEAGEIIPPDQRGAEPVRTAQTQAEPAPPSAEPAPLVTDAGRSRERVVPADAPEASRPAVAADASPITAATETATKPPAAAPAPAGEPAEDAALRAAFFRGLGLDPATVAGAATPEDMAALGKRFRMMAEGLVHLLRTRAREKQNVRVALTIVGSSDVNPLKFMANTDEVLASLIAPRGPGYLKPDEAISAAFRDLADHQMRTWVGMQSALRQMIDRFDPGQIERELEELGLIKALLAGGRNAKLWQLYNDRYKDIARSAEDRFLGEVGADFRDAYEGNRRMTDDPKT